MCNVCTVLRDSNDEKAHEHTDDVDKSLTEKLNLTITACCNIKVQHDVLYM